MLNVRLNINVELTLNHEPFHLYGELARVFLRKNRGESLRHVMMKFMSYVLLYHEDLLIEASADQHYKPDLVRFNLRGEPLQWVDCGKTSIHKLDRISRKNQETLIDIVKATPGELAAYHEQARERIALPERVRYWSFGGRFIDELGELLRGRHTVHATVTPGFERVYLLIDERFTLESEVTQLGEARSPDRNRLYHLQ